MHFSEVIQRAITLAEALNAAYAARRAKWPGKTIGGLRCIRLSDVPDEPPPPQRDDLRRFLLGQSPGTIYLLAAVMYHGRGDFDPEFLLDEYVDLSDTFPKPEAMVDQMMGKALARYLRDGQRELTAAGVNLDELHAG